LAALAAPRTIRPLVTVARQGWAAIAAAAREEHPDLLIIGWRRPGWDFLGTTIEDVLRDPPCDLAIVKGPAGRARRILVPIRGGRYAELAAKIGVDLARARKGTVTLLHVAPEDRATRRSAATLYQLVGERAFDERVDELLTRVGEAEPVITDELERHDLVVFGASGSVIQAIRSRLMDRVALVDELIVIDSESTDRTREIARSLGVPVHIHQEVLPEVGPGRGKGEALWKSLAVTTGELVVWVDTDVSQFHPKFVYGLIGPLLVRPDIAFVKAFYRRPLNVGGELHATGEIGRASCRAR